MSSLILGKRKLTTVLGDERGQKRRRQGAVKLEVLEWIKLQQMETLAMGVRVRACFRVSAPDSDFPATAVLDNQVL
jgi:hypothetical protein